MPANKHIPGGVKGFLVLHVEKIVLGVCVALVALFFCLGYGIETIPKEQNPAALYAQIELAKAHIAVDSWEDIGPSRTITPNHLERAVKSRKSIDQDYYSIGQYWTWPKFPLNEKRLDPTVDPKVDPPSTTLQPPLNVLAWATVAPVVEPPQPGRVNRLDQLPIAREDPPEEPKKVIVKKKPKRPSPDDEFLDEALDEEPLDEDIIDDPAMSEGGRSGRVKQLSVAQRDELLRGTYQIRGSNSNMGVVGRNLVVVTCMVPYRQHRQVFDACFVNAMSYDPMRDRPEYFYYVAQRAESDGTIPEDKLDWKTVNDTKYMLGLAKRWSQVQVEELIDTSQVHPAMTAPILPALLQPAANLATQPKNPKIKFKTQEQLRLEKEMAAKGETTPKGPMEPIMPGDFSGAPRSLNDTPTSVDSGDPASDEIDDLDPDLDMEEDLDGGGDLSPQPIEEEDLADFLLVRFYDLTAKRGQSYVYRVKVFLRDPNNPMPGKAVGADVGENARDFNPDNVGLGHPAVPERALDEQILDKVKTRREAGQYYIATEYSQPSPAVRVPELPQRLLAGAVQAPRYTPLKEGGRVLRKGGEATADVLAVTWSDEFGIFIPGVTTAYHGSLLNFTDDADVLHPLRMTLKELKGHFFETDAVVLDMRGGVNLGTSSKPLYTPGEVLILDRDGNLIVRNELDDAETYRRQLFIEDRGSQGAGSSPSGGETYDEGLDDPIGLDDDIGFP
ncbi:MAG: hypothetical protein RIC55_33540 [Pirellulaceae bacterium]